MKKHTWKKRMASALLVCLMLNQPIMGALSDESEMYTEAPTETPTQAPTQVPTQAPTKTPTQAPTEAPTEAPAEAPTETPSEVPTDTPTQAPTSEPTAAPTVEPTDEPTETPFSEPTNTPETLLLAERAMTLSDEPVEELSATPSFTVVIPSSVSIDSNGDGVIAITASGETTSGETKLTAHLESDFTLSSAEGNKIAYAVTAGGTELASGQAAAVFGTAGEATLSLSLKDKTAHYSGGIYTDTITFRISFE